MTRCSRGIEALNDPMDVGSLRGLELSRRLFEQRGLALLDRCGVSGVCSVACVGGTSQNAAMDDDVSRDHCWGPYLTFLLADDAWRRHGDRLKRALQDLPDRVGRVVWRGYDGPEPRRTNVFEIVRFLSDLTGYREPPVHDIDWLPYLTAQGFLGRRWTERLFDASQGAVFHDPGNQFTDSWRRYVRYPPRDIQKALLARVLFRTWNAGPEYNLARAWQRGDLPGFAQCRSLFVNEVMEMAFCLNKSFVPAPKWRAVHFERLPDCPATIRKGVSSLAVAPPTEQALIVANDVVQAVKRVVSNRFSLSKTADEPLSTCAHAIHQQIDNRTIRQATVLDW